MKLLLVMVLSFITPFVFATKTDYKLGICTGTVSQGEDEFRAAEQLVKKYPKNIIHVTYPDNFMQEQETTVSNIASLASDKNVRAIMIAQGVPGTMAGIRKAKELRKKNKALKEVPLSFFVWEAAEDPDQVDKEANLILGNDNVARGKTIPQLAKKLGAKTLIHYSFPRHMSYKILADRRDVMKKECDKLKIKFVFAAAPDPVGEGGIPAAQQFILEDVSRKVKEYGKDTAFFCTNDAMTEPLIKKVAEHKAIFVEPDMPSPTMGFPGALGVKIDQDKAGDFDYINKQIKEAIKKMGNSGRMATWPVPASITSIKGVADLLFDTNFDPKSLTDRSKIENYLKKQAGVKVTLSLYGKTKNYQLLMMDDIVY